MTSPPRSVPRDTDTGRCPNSPNTVTSAPKVRRASCRSDIGRPRNASCPSMIVVASDSAAMAVTKRDVVPASRASIIVGNREAEPPFIETDVSPTWKRHFVSDNASTSTCVSSPSGRPEMVEVPSANIAQTSARFAMLFDPGTEMWVSTGPAGIDKRVSLMTKARVLVEILARVGHHGKYRRVPFESLRPSHLDRPRRSAPLQSHRC